MNPVETMWEFVVSELEFRTPIVVGACILCTVVGLLRKLERWRYKVAVAVMAVGLVAVEWNLFMKWNYITIYLLAGFLILFPVLCFFILFLWNRYRLGEIRKMCEQQSYVEALNLLYNIKIEGLTKKQLYDYKKRESPDRLFRRIIIPRDFTVIQNTFRYLSWLNE